ncbi:MAG: ribosome biogenesis GTP-binding protein YihA/YsxC, partial [Alphaproteobacteria bacterium]|nr:ribosome biogenesis GTP-binding protein YihA/YsxC [Alphaproteobacteria bacterium]
MEHPAPSEEALEYGRWLFAQECEFQLGVAHLRQLPESNLPEIAFCGRSNVGKSSLINALTGRTTLAKTSNTPGRTQQINMFKLAHRLMLSDLPGHGYAKAPVDVVEQWHKLINTYL